MRIGQNSYKGIEFCRNENVTSDISMNLNEI